MEIQGNSNYLIYDDGRVWSKRRNIFLKPQTLKNGYLWVCLSNQKKHLIHRLVAGSFIPNLLNKTDVHHEDGNKTNNHVSNLRWVTHMENMNSFQSIQKNNKYGITGISKDRSRWRYRRSIYGKIYEK